NLRLQLREILLAGQGRLQNLLELLVPLETAAQIRQLLSQLEKLTQRLHLLCDPLRREVVEPLKAQIDRELASVGVLGKQIVNGEGEVGTHALQHVVEIVRRYLDEL